MTFSPGRFRSGPTSVLALLALVACSAPTDPDEAGPVLFLTQNAVPDATMDALFEGRVSLDGAGCLRLDLDGEHTVVWPTGYTLESTDRGLAVRDGEGRVVGHVAGSFRLSGGEVQALHDGIGMDRGEKAEAEIRCPGRYWIVGAGF